MPTIVFCGAAAVMFAIVLLIHGLFTSTDPSHELPTAVAQPEIVEAALVPPALPSIRATIRVVAPNYTVTSGDTLSGIAQRFNTTVAALTGINNLPSGVVLIVGQHLVIPGPRPAL